MSKTLPGPSVTQRFRGCKPSVWRRLQKTGKDEVMATGGAVPFSNDVHVLSFESRIPPAHDIFDVAAADADIAQLMIRELRQFAHRVSIPEPSVELLRDHFEGDHLDSFSDALRRLESQPPSKGGGPANLGLEHFDYYPAWNGVTLHR
jgi:hypothetical protein